MPAQVVTFPSASPAPGPFETFLAGRANRTKRAYSAALAALCGGPPGAFRWDRLTVDGVTAMRTGQASVPPATANLRLAALRGVLGTCFQLGLIDGDLLARLCMAARSFRGSRLPTGRVLSAQEIGALYLAASLRERVLLHLLYQGGLRRFEAASTRVRDCNLDSGAVIVRGKGDKEREVPAFAPPASLADLRAWAEGLQLPPDAPLLGLTDGGVRFVLDGLRRRAGVAPFAPHDLRRTFVTALEAGGSSALLISHLAGHADPRTTARYFRAEAQAGISAVRRIAVWTGLDADCAKE